MHCRIRCNEWQSLAVWGGAGGSGPCRPVVLEDLEVLEHSPHQVLPVDVHNTGPTQREPRVEQKDLSAPLVRDDAAAERTNYNDNRAPSKAVPKYDNKH